MTGKNPNAVAQTGLDGSFNDIEGRFNTKFNWGNSIDQAYQAVQNGGDGTRALVGIEYDSGGSHVVTMTNNGGRVGIIEGQDWGSGQSSGVIYDPSQENSRYNADGKSNIGIAIIPNK